VCEQSSFCRSSRTPCARVLAAAEVRCFKSSLSSFARASGSAGSDAAWSFSPPADRQCYFPNVEEEWMQYVSLLSLLADCDLLRRDLISSVKVDITAKLESEGWSL
jgi:hypothetical protein